MAAKKRSEPEPTDERMLAVLERIEKELTGLRREVRATNTGLAALSNEIHEFRVEMHDELLDLRAEQHEQRTEATAKIEARLSTLEAAVFRRTGT